MTPPGDPYRVLGLPHDASLEDVKHAYRRLAKASHPDSAGSTATGRFIALQQAYEALLRIAPVGPRRTPAGVRTPGRRPAPGARPRARTAPTGASSSGRSATPPPRGAPPTRGAPRPEGPPSPDPARPDRGESSTRRRGARRATLGTTSYDDAEAGRPADWQGASWYGVSTGTYWTLNPKEYADPRKHGPEYLARGRRQAVDAGAEPDDPIVEPADTMASDPRRPSGRAHAPSLLRRILDRARRA